jgi:hypothetical protein
MSIPFRSWPQSLFSFVDIFCPSAASSYFGPIGCVSSLGPLGMRPRVAARLQHPCGCPPMFIYLHTPVKSSRPIIADSNAPPVRASQAEHRCRDNAPTQPARACRPSIVGASPQHPHVGGACRCAACRKFHVTSEARDFLPSWGAGPRQPNPQSTSSKGAHLRWTLTPCLRLASIRHLPRSAHRCIAGLGPTTARAMSSTRGNSPAAMPTSTGWPQTRPMPSNPM